MKSALLALIVFASASVGGAATVTVGPHGQYPTPCAAFAHLADGDTVLIDANHQIPYYDTHDCYISNNNLTIVGINGRPILDGTKSAVQKGIWVENGHDVVIDNFEFRNANATANPNTQLNAAGIRIQDSNGSGGPPSAGGNVTIQSCYIHDDGMGVLGANAGPTQNNQGWYSPNPYITFQYDEIYHGGAGAVGTNDFGHNIYMGYGGNMDFTFQYSWSHDALEGHVLKTRAPINNILYSMVSDAEGSSSFILDFPHGGTTYVVGNVIEKGPISPAYANYSSTLLIMWRQDSDSNPNAFMYGVPHDDLHFINNTVVDDPSNNFPDQFVTINCLSYPETACPALNPGTGPELVTPPVFENNIFIGPPQSNGTVDPITNQVSNPASVEENNILLLNTPANLASLRFVDPAALDFHLLPGSPAIGEGIYPPTNANGMPDPQSLAVYEYSTPVGMVPRPTPSGSTMDAGAFHFAPPMPSHIQLNYTRTVSSGATGTIRVSGLSIAPMGPGQQGQNQPWQHKQRQNYVAFASGNQNAIGEILTVPSFSGTAVTTFTALPVTAPTVVPIYVYVEGQYLTAYVTVTP